MEETMARKGENIYKRKDGRWEGRYHKINMADGRQKYASVYGKTYKEVKEKLFLKKREQLREKGGFLSRDEIVAELATFFGVPETSVKIRFEELGLN